MLSVVLLFLLGCFVSSGVFITFLFSFSILLCFNMGVKMWGLMSCNTIFFSKGLMILSLVVILGVSMSIFSFKINYFYNIFKLLLIFLVIFLVFFFTCDKLLGFYCFFELSVVPVFLMLIGWGYHPERYQAFMYMVLYTILGSFPFLLVLSDLVNLGLVELSDLDLVFVMDHSGVLMMLPFLIKLPIYGFHLWLPMAHVESPTEGSMILAGIMLKMSFYGVFQVGLVFNYFKSGVVYCLFLSLAIIGSLVSSLSCMRQFDLKCLVAYSSISHMGLGMGSMLSGGFQGFNSVLYLCISHGMCSAGLFFISGLIYGSVFSRSLFIVGGLGTLSMPMGIWCFLFCLFNMSAPFTLSILAEISLLMSSVSFSFLLGGMFVLSCFMGSVFSLYLFSTTILGSAVILNVGVLSVKESLVFMVYFGLIVGYLFIGDFFSP